MRLPRRQQESYGVGGRGPPTYNTLAGGGGGGQQKRPPSYKNGGRRPNGQAADNINNFSDILRGSDFGLLGE